MSVLDFVWPLCLNGKKIDHFQARLQRTSTPPDRVLRKLLLNETKMLVFFYYTHRGEMYFLKDVSPYGRQKIRLNTHDKNAV